MSTRALVLVTSLFTLLGCDAEKEGGSATIPESLRGAYGRTDADAFFPTLGLEVDVDTLRISELTLKIKAGKEVGTDTFQIDEAELRWANASKEPETCKGTIARHGTRLLLTLFKTDREAKCDSALVGDWEAWAPVESIPESLAGSYGRKDPYARAEGLKLDGTSIELTGRGNAIELEQAVMYASKPNHLVIRKGVFGGRVCQGHIDLVEEHLEGSLEPAKGSDGACPRVFGHRWSVDTARIPKKPLSNGKVSVEVRGEAVLLKTLDEQGLTCEQAIVRTATRNVADSGRDGIPVMGGEVLVLQDAKPKAGAGACADRLDGLAAAQCEQYLGLPCDEGMLSSVAHGADEVSCPTHVIIGEPEGEGRKVAFLPQSLENAVCWELRDRLK
ncbi:MAG: hypothetical protein AAGA54_11095 [Myxococcota bacterium]